jgi:hypothetical protein
MLLVISVGAIGLSEGDEISVVLSGVELAGGVPVFSGLPSSGGSCASK